MTETTKAPKPAVFDGRPADKQEAITLNVRVKLLGEKDVDGAGKALEGTVTGIEYQRQRVVVKLDTQEKLIVRPAAKVWVLKSKAGKVLFDTERMAKAVRGAKATEATPATPADDEAPAPV